MAVARRCSGPPSNDDLNGDGDNDDGTTSRRPGPSSSFGKVVVMHEHHAWEDISGGLSNAAV